MLAALGVDGARAETLCLHDYTHDGNSGGRNGAEICVGDIGAYSGRHVLRVSVQCSRPPQDAPAYGGPYHNQWRHPALRQVPFVLGIRVARQVQSFTGMPQSHARRQYLAVPLQRVQQLFERLVLRDAR